MSLQQQRILFLCCHFYIVILANYMSDLLNIDRSIPTENDKKLLDIILYRNYTYIFYYTKTNQSILFCTPVFRKHSTVFRATRSI